MVFELIPIKNLMSNQVYQRPLSEGHIISAVKDFDVYQINPVKVSRRNGINYVFPEFDRGRKWERSMKGKKTEV